MAAWVFILPLIAIILCLLALGIRKNSKAKKLKMELEREAEILKNIQNNINQGVFFMDRELRILPGYSKPLVSILSYYDSELAGKNLMEILGPSVEAGQQQILKRYFNMIFEKSKSARVLESVNPLSEFDYKTEDRIKHLAANFYLIEKKGFENVIMGIVQDISRERSFRKLLQIQKEAQEQEMKDMFDIIQIDPLVFQDFIEEADSNFNYINSILKDRDLSANQVIDKFYQNIHALKSNASILGMETFTGKLQVFEDHIKGLMTADVSNDDILGLAIKLETLMRERDNYITIVKKIDDFKNSNQVDTILVHSMNQAAEKTAAEVKKKVEVKAGYLDMDVLESKLRKIIKDILFQLVRNSIYYDIESTEERIKKNKSPLGLLVFSIKNEDGEAEVYFSDDGTGAGSGSGLNQIKDLIKQNHGRIKIDSSESGWTIKFTLPMPK